MITLSNPLALLGLLLLPATYLLYTRMRREPVRVPSVLIWKRAGGKGEGADIRLKGFFVGKVAFIISKRPNGFYITHSGGRSMTKVNGVEVEGQRELRDRDIIDIGWTRMQFYTKK